jgi:hypothetical protein
MRPIIILLTVYLISYNCYEALAKGGSFTQENRINPNCTLEGHLDRVSPKGTWILYRVPDTWEPDDYTPGSLRLFNVKTAELIVINKQITIEDPKGEFLSDSLVVLPAKGQLLTYDIGRKAFSNTLLSFNKDYSLLAFSLNDDKSKVALLLHDTVTRQAFLKVVDLINAREYNVGYQDFQPESCNEYYVGEILWCNDQLVYSLQYKLYQYTIDASGTVLLAYPIYSYALDKDRVLFITRTDKGRRLSLKEINLQYLTTRELKLNDNFAGVPAYSIELYNVNINNVKRAFLSVAKREDRHFFSVKENGSLIEEDKLLLYKTQGFTIERLSTEVLTPNGLGHKITLVIQKE